MDNMFTICMFKKRTHIVVYTLYIDTSNLNLKINFLNNPIIVLTRLFEYAHVICTAVYVWVPSVAACHMVEHAYFKFN